MRNRFQGLPPPDFHAPLASNLLLTHGNGNGAAYDAGGAKVQAYTEVLNGASRRCLGAFLDDTDDRIEFAAGNYDRSEGSFCFWQVPGYDDSGIEALLSFYPFNSDPSHRALLFRTSGWDTFAVVDGDLTPLYLCNLANENVINVSRFLACVYGGGKMRLMVNGLWGSEGNFAGVDGDCTKITLGIDADLVGIASGSDSIFADLMTWRRKLSTLELDRIYHATKALHGRAA